MIVNFEIELWLTWKLKKEATKFSEKKRKKKNTVQIICF